jgi:hypothetical protein
MAVLAANKSWTTSADGTLLVPVNSGVTIFQGSLVFGSSVSGLAIAWSDLATTFFLGIAKEKVVGTASNPKVAVDTAAKTVHGLTVVGVSAIDDVFDLVFALNDNLNDCTLTANVNQKAIGYVSAWHNSSTLCDVRLFSAEQHRAHY